MLTSLLMWVPPHSTVKDQEFDHTFCCTPVSVFEITMFMLNLVEFMYVPSFSCDFDYCLSMSRYFIQIMLNYDPKTASE